MASENTKTLRAADPLLSHKWRFYVCLLCRKDGGTLQNVPHSKIKVHPVCFAQRGMRGVVMEIEKWKAEQDEKAQS